jgi:Cysteine-rich CPXCG
MNRLREEQDGAVGDSVHNLGPGDSDTPPEPAEFNVWDTEAGVSCPYCGEAVTIAIDPAGGVVQTYLEDCQVCCQPWQVHLTYDDQGRADVWVEAAQDRAE